MKWVLRIWLGVVIVMAICVALLDTFNPDAAGILTKMTLGVATAGLVTLVLVQESEGEEVNLPARRRPEQGKQVEDSCSRRPALLIKTEPIAAAIVG